MRILTVIPIARGIQKNTLTYFSKENIEKGSIVSIPLRKKDSFGLVIESKEAQVMKSEIKNLSFNLRKTNKVEAHTFLSQSFIQSAEKAADYYAGSVGSVLSALIPQKILENSAELPHIPQKLKKDDSEENFYETVLLQSNDEERYATYKSLIREEFARNRSVFFCLPTTEDILTAEQTLQKGIEAYTFVIHSALSAKEVIRLWKQIVTDPHPVLIIATGPFLCIPREDIRTIILEQESSRAYKMQVRPFVDLRTFASMFAKLANSKLVLGDTLLRTETLWEGKNGTYAELSPLKFRSLSTATCTLEDMRVPAEMHRKAEKKEFTIFSTKLLDLLKKNRENNEHIFLFAGRKGLYPTTVCTDCGTIVTCTNCNAPVVLYAKKNPEKNLFVCHHCGERRNADLVCTYCKGWRLNPLGIGVERVAEEVKKMHPTATLVLIDKDHVSTHKQAVKARDTFYNSPGSIMVGTEMALTYLNQKVENTAVVSMDSFFSIPDFRIHEKIFHILLHMRALSEKSMIVQTRQKDTKIFDYALRGNLVDFYRDEIEERKEFGYPPFTTYIKVTLEGEKNKVKKQMEEIKKLLLPQELTVFDAFSPGKEKKHTIHGLLTLQKGVWPDSELLSKLRTLPPYCMVKVDPDTLL